MQLYLRPLPALFSSLLLSIIALPLICTAIHPCFADEVVQFDKILSLGGKCTRIPSNSVLLLTGPKTIILGLDTYNLKTNELKITVVVLDKNVKDTTTTVIVDGDRWYCKAGPFDAGSKISFMIHLDHNLDAIESKRLTDTLTTDFESASIKTFDTFKDGTPEEFVAAFIKNLTINNKKDFKNLKRPNDTLLLDIIPKILLKSEDKIKEFANNIGQKKAKKNEITTIIDETLKSAINDPNQVTQMISTDNLEWKEDAKRKFDALNSTDNKSDEQNKLINTLKANLGILDDLDNSIQKLKDTFKTDLSMDTLIKENSTITSSSTESAGSTAIEGYAGFDVGAMAVIPNYDSTATLLPFFLVSPTIGKRAINDDPCICNFWEYVTPTVGIALADAPFAHTGGVYFAGVGIRLSKMFRFAGGRVFYRRDNAKNWGTETALSLAISYNSLSDLIAIFGKAQSGLSSKPTTPATNAETK